MKIDRMPCQRKHPGDVIKCATNGGGTGATGTASERHWEGRSMETLWKPQTAWKPPNPAAPEKKKLRVCGINKQTHII